MKQGNLFIGEDQRQPVEDWLIDMGVLPGLGEITSMESVDYEISQPPTDMLTADADSQQPTADVDTDS